MRQVVSADDTKIAFDRTGCGPAVILVMGGKADRHARRFVTFSSAEKGYCREPQAGRRPRTAHALQVSVIDPSVATGSRLRVISRSPV